MPYGIKKQEDFGLGLGFDLFDAAGSNLDKSTKDILSTTGTGYGEGRVTPTTTTDLDLADIDLSTGLQGDYSQYLPTTGSNQWISGLSNMDTGRLGLGVLQGGIGLASYLDAKKTRKKQNELIDQQIAANKYAMEQQRAGDENLMRIFRPDEYAKQQGLGRL